MEFRQTGGACEVVIDDLVRVEVEIDKHLEDVFPCLDGVLLGPYQING